MTDEGLSSRRKRLEINAVDPTDGKLITVLISYDRMQAIGKRSVGQARECGEIVPKILQEPTAIFEGLCQEDDEDLRGTGWRCYCGIPPYAFHRDGSERRPYPGQVYLVFVNDERVAYNWRWEKSDPDNPKLPQDHQTRFRKNLI